MAVFLLLAHSGVRGPRNDGKSPDSVMILEGILSYLGKDWEQTTFWKRVGHVRAAEREGESVSKPGRGRLPGGAEGSGLFGAFISSTGRARVAHANGEQGCLRTLQRKMANPITRRTNAFLTFARARHMTWAHAGPQLGPGLSGGTGRSANAANSAQAMGPCLVACTCGRSAPPAPPWSSAEAPGSSRLQC